MVNRSAQRAARILKHLGEEGRPQGLTLVARALDLHPSTVHRILCSLVSEGLVEQDPVSLKYGLSIELFALARSALRQLGVHDRVQTELRSLAENEGETVNFGVIRGQRVVYLFNLESKETLHTGAKVGSSVPAHATAIGKVILAWAPQRDIQRYLHQAELRPYTPKSITRPEQLLERLEQIRQDGYTLDLEECNVGVTAAGAPVRDVSGAVLAGMAVTGPIGRMSRKVSGGLIARLLRTANRVSRLLGCVDESFLDLERYADPRALWETLSPRP